MTNQIFMLPKLLPGISFFLGKIVPLDNLIPAIEAYASMLDEKLPEIEIYEKPMDFVEFIDYQEKINNFLAVLIDERERIKITKAQSSGDAGADDARKKKR